MDKIQEIRKALETATPGPWRYNGNEVVAYANPRVGIAGAMSEEDCELIANAPEWLSYLLTELDIANEHVGQLQQQLEEVTERSMKRKYELEELNLNARLLRDAYNTAKQENERLKREKDVMTRANNIKATTNDELRQQLKQAIEALEWYAANGSQFSFLYDYGKTARETLAYIREGESHGTR